jgi:hypothetical protein
MTNLKNETTLGLFALLFVLIVTLVTSFGLFDDDKPIELTRFHSGSSAFEFAINYIPSNATRQDYISVQQIYTGGSVRPLMNFERYQILKSYQIIGDSLQIVLADTSSYVPRIDTLKIKIQWSNK